MKRRILFLVASCMSKSDFFLNLGIFNLFINMNLDSSVIFYTKLDVITLVVLREM